MWPWIWFDTGARLGAYFNFHLHHYGILFYFGGTLYNQNPAPWFAPLTMLSITTPVVTLVLVLMGLWASPAGPLKRFAGAAGPSPAHRRVAAGDRQVRGVKLFLPVFPYLCVLAGLGFATAARELTKPWMQRALVAVCLMPALAGVVAYRGYWLSYYNEIIGGVRGATRSGFERQYYDLAYPELREALRKPRRRPTRRRVSQPQGVRPLLRSLGPKAHGASSGRRHRRHPRASLARIPRHRSPLSYATAD